MYSFLKAFLVLMKDHCSIAKNNYPKSILDQHELSTNPEVNKNVNEPCDK